MPATWSCSPVSSVPARRPSPRASGSGLGVRGAVTSPTFVIARVHPSLVGGPDLVHVDAYRLGGIAELDDLDLDTSLDDAVTVVEWGAGLAEGLAESRLEITHHPGAGRRVDRRRAGSAGGPRPPRARLSNLAIVLLSFDTATSLVTVALHDGDDVVAERLSELPMKHGEQLAPLHRSSARRHRARPPGPHRDRRRCRTRARSPACGSAWSPPAPSASSWRSRSTACAPSTSLAIEAIDSGAVAGDFLVATDARRKEVYLAAYDDRAVASTGPVVSRPADVASELPVAGEGARALSRVLPQRGRARPVRARAGWPAVVAEERAELLDPEPLYLRRPDAVANAAAQARAPGA